MVKQKDFVGGRQDSDQLTYKIKFVPDRITIFTTEHIRSLTLVINGVPSGINLGQGVCDLDSPSPLVQGGIASIDGGDRQLYTPYTGLPELREAIADKLRRHNGLDYTGKNVAVCTGSSGAFFAAGMTLIEPGDEVVLFEPFYSYHWTTVPLFGAVPKAVRLRGASLEFDPDALRAVLTDRTRAVVVNTPGNPSGKIWTREELVELGHVLEGTDIAVFTDEVYEYMCFDGREHISPATIPELADRTLTMNSFSKTFSVTGWRIGFLAGHEEIVEKCGVVFDQMEVCAARPMQRGVQQRYAQTVAELEARPPESHDDAAGGGVRVAPPPLIPVKVLAADEPTSLGDASSLSAAPLPTPNTQLGHIATRLDGGPFTRRGATRPFVACHDTRGRRPSRWHESRGRTSLGSMLN